MTRTDPCPAEGSATDAEQFARARMSQVACKLLVLSGKGGVGKSTVAANIAWSLAAAGKTVGLLDVDMHGPSIPAMFGLNSPAVAAPDTMELRPVTVTERLSVMSIGLLVAGRSEAVIWRGPLKYAMIRRLLGEVAWGPLDYLVVDSPPGTGDEPLAAAQLVGDGACALVVTTPQALAVNDVRRCITFCHKLELPVLGIVENMSVLTCPHCGKQVDLFPTGGGQALAQETALGLLEKIPFDPAIGVCGDAGTPIASANGPSAEAFARLAAGILATHTEPKRSTP